MENASKALLMAGSVLIGILILSLMLFVFNHISSFEQTKSDVEAEKKMQNYNIRFEQFNKNIYGSELLSLGNLQANYNDREVDLKGYNFVTINVEMKRSVESNSKVYVDTGNKTMGDIRTGLSSLEKDIAYYEDEKNGYENKKESAKRSVKYYAQLSNRQIATLFEINYGTDDLDYDIGEMLANPLKSNTKVSNLMKDIEEYKVLKTVYSEFKNTMFRCNNVVYDDVGRVTLMNFIEV